ncbi:MAG: MarR family transcriptional regulator [Pseudomonas sp.]|nr:MAG: MarR family transcriptional regulator [Pseudomonas sp.]
MDAVRFDLSAAEEGLNDEDNFSPTTQTVALAWMAARKARDRVFASPLFHNPAWDILLELYVHRTSSETCVFQVCAGSSSPPTTVLRWIGVLESEGLIERCRDQKDRRRSLLKLSALGLSKMEEALDAATESDRRLGLGRLRLVS